MAQSLIAQNTLSKILHCQRLLGENIGTSRGRIVSLRRRTKHRTFLPPRDWRRVCLVGPVGLRNSHQRLSSGHSGAHTALNHPFVGRRDSVVAICDVEFSGGLVVGPMEVGVEVGEIAASGELLVVGESVGETVWGLIYEELWVLWEEEDGGASEGREWQ
ncbi:Cytochrome b561 and DOMON domain-containing protein [Senna tora]|uniref:Cytochrome b561 and DOMON domain-containing protein n=1 Tax=Senna tora TaxID=362788 RepID=A0A834SV17_9FABA|nr:Cytochrome b561 and DOMON domain-containing protein [Senna tora]